MALLNFKHGLLTNFKENSPAFAAGTIYITRDERAMYVDLPAYMDGESVAHEAKRIRIGDMRTYTYLEDLQNDLKTDMTTLTTSALFYAEKKKGMVDGVHDTSKDVIINALLKWNGTQFIQLNDTSTLASAISTLEGTIAEHTTQLGEINTALSEINTDIENITKEEDGAIAVAVAAAVDSLTTLINGKVAQNDFDTLSQTVADNNAATTTKFGEIDGTLSDHADDIDELQAIVNELVGGESGAGAIGEQIDAKIQAHAEAQALIDAAQDEIISGHTTTIGEHATSIGTLTTDLSGVITNLTDNYYTKNAIDNKGYAVATDVANTYATKEAFNAHVAIAATKEELNGVSTVANEAKAATVTNAGSITTLSGEFSGYKTSNDTALAGVKATAEAAVTKADYDLKIAALEAEDERIAGLVTAEQSRAEGVEADFETRISEIELFFDAAADPDSTIDNLNEILQYIEDHKGEAIDMAGDIQENANAISGLDTRLTTAEGKVTTLESGLATEITDRVAAITDAITTANTYTDTQLTWGQF